MARIFVADDEDLVRESLEQWFTFLGDQVVTVANGDLADLHLQTNDYDVLILDWEMGRGLTGPDVVREYRGRGGNGIVILLTGRGDLADKEVGFEAGVDDYMVKPFHLKEIGAKVKALLRRVQPRAAQPEPKKQSIRVTVCDSCGTIYDAGSTHCFDCCELLNEEEFEFPGGEQFSSKYEVNGVLGRGGMSIVFKARHRVLNKDFAIKFLDVSRARDAEYLRRFELEAQALSRMSHQHVVAIHDYGVSEDRHPYIVMDFVEGVPLSRALCQLDQFSIPRCMAIFMQSCQGIGHAHKQGIIHRDLKPGNIILGEREDRLHVFIVDFGVAKRIETEDKPAERLTKEGKVFGTTTYMSPEHCLGQQLDQRSDIYAFGCIMYEMLAGRPPFVGENVLDTLQKQIYERPLALKEARGKDDLPGELEKIVHKTLEKFPENRYQSMDELLAALLTVRPTAV
jgi:eukaryotic-like serine/threonine-protein kinase